MKRVPRYLAAAMILGSTCSASQAFSPAAWAEQAPGLMLTTEVRVALTFALGHINLAILDNRTGITQRQVVDGRGLDSIRDRVAAIGGSISIISPPGGGCQVSVAVPLTQAFALG